MLRQTVRDFMVNQQFRRDYWVKGTRKLNAIQQIEGINAQRILLTVSRDEVILKAQGRLGEANLPEATYNPIIDALSDHKIKTIAQLEFVVKDRGISFTKLVQAVIILVGNGTLAIAQDDKIIASVKKQTDKLNARIMDLARGSSDINFLASPVTGGGITVGRFHQLFLLAMTQGKKKPDEWADAVWQLLLQRDQKIVNEGKTLESPEENIEELKKRAKYFSQKQLPILKALQII